MKKILLLLSALIVFQLTTAYSQCEPDVQYMDFPIGIYPIDTVDTPVPSLPVGQENQLYETTLTVALPDIVMVPNPNGPPSPLGLDSIIVNNITGLPPGVTYECNTADCIFPAQALNCIVLSGTPTDAGTYPLTIQAQFYAFPISPETTFPGDLLSGEYNIIIEEAVAVDTPIENTIGLGQNIPNPFGDVTEIQVDAKESGIFDFQVYNVIGKLLYNEQVALSAGANVIPFDGSKLYSGMYFYSVGQGNDRMTRRMVVHRP